MKVKETFLVKIKYELSSHGDKKYLVEGVKELSKLLNLLSTSSRYSLISISKIGAIQDYDGLVEDLIDEQKPNGLDCGCKFI